MLSREVLEAGQAVSHARELVCRALRADAPWADVSDAMAAEKWATEDLCRAMLAAGLDVPAGTMPSGVAVSMRMVSQ